VAITKPSELPVDDLARELFEAERASSALEPLSRRFPSLTAQEAYAIQESYADLRRSHGATLVGRKIGCTSRAIQEQFGVDTPDYGHLFDDMVVADGGSISLTSLIEPLVEPELAFLLSRDLRGPGLTRADVLDATESISACLEVIDSRIRNWEIVFVDTVADNGSSARCAIGAPRAPRGLGLDSVAGVLRRNGEEVACARGDAVLGHPADAVAWLVNQLGEFGRGVAAGDYILSGSFTSAVRAAEGDVFEASFDGFDSVSLRVVA
jgi:2-keto-4-pentenoate hydratase